MSRRLESGLALVLLGALVVLRSWPFVAHAGSHFDSDQAIVGLMAKHVSEGRAFPLYYYGQSYMLAIEAWLAAPVMWALGPTVTALKLPLVAVNLATVFLLWRLAVRDAGLRPWLAAIAVLPLAMPAAGVAARVVEANGGNVEPWLYVLLIWVLRGRPWTLGAALGAMTLHRAFALYGALALLLLDVRRRIVSGPRELATDWTVTAVALLAVRAAAAAIQPFASALGPGTSGDHPDLLMRTVDTLGGRLCLVPGEWPARAWLLVTDHLPRLVGGAPAPLRDYGVLTGVFSGTSGLGLWVGGLTLVGLAGAVWEARRLRASSAVTPATRAASGLSLPAYLILAGAISIGVYGFATCSDIKVETLRYDLLGVFVPVGALIMALAAWTTPAARAGLGAAVALWCALNASDVLAVSREYRRDPPADQRQALATALERRGIAVARSAFRNAYHITFLSRERVRIAATDFDRIDEYRQAAIEANVPTLTTEACDSGEVLLPGAYLCP